jgi:hypothetical protein
MSRRPDPVCNGAGQLFSAAAQRGALCIAKQNSWPAAILRSAAALRVQPVSASGKGIAVKAAMGAADPSGQKGTRHVTLRQHLPLFRQ